VSARHRLRWRDNSAEGMADDPILTITVEGSHDVYRLMDVLQRAQLDFAAHGHSIRRALVRKKGRAYMKAADDYFYGRGVS
jgi:hypothetical protein